MTEKLKTIIDNYNEILNGFEGYSCALKSRMEFSKLNRFFVEHRNGFEGYMLSIEYDATKYIIDHFRQMHTEIKLLINDNN